MRNFKLTRADVLTCALVFVALGMQASYITQPSTGGSNFPSTQTPAFVAAVEAHTNTTPLTFSVTMGTQPVVGDIIVVGFGILGSSADGSGATMADNQTNGYTRLSQFALAGSVPRAQLWCGLVAKSSGTFTITATILSNDQPGLIAAEYSGMTCNPDRVQFATSGATSPYACGAGIVTNNAKDLLVTFINAGGATGTTTFTPSTGFTERKNQAAAASGLVLSLADNITSATGTFNPTYGTGQNHASTPCVFASLLSR